MRTSFVTVACSACLVAALGACDRRDRAPARDSVTAVPPAVVPAESVHVDAPVSGWDPTAGTALLVPGEGGEALVVVPGAAGDSATDRTAGRAADVLPAEVALFSRAGASGRARAEPTGARAATCGWPAARLGPASGADVLPAWTVGFVGGAPSPVALDSIEGTSPVDSAALAVTATRLAAGLHDDTVRAFHGVPYTVRSARRFPVGGGAREGLVAVLTRAVNQEAAPLSEQLLLLAERSHTAGGGTPGPWLVAYHERAAGREDAVPATDVLAAALLGADRREVLVLARAFATGNGYALLERTGDLVWRLRWTSVVRGC